jgi:hypothetical protein
MKLTGLSNLGKISFAYKAPAAYLAYNPPILCPIILIISISGLVLTNCMISNANLCPPILTPSLVAKSAELAVDFNTAKLLEPAIVFNLVSRYTI